MPLWLYHGAASLRSWIEFNCLRSAAVGKVARLSIYWLDAACRLVIPLRQVALAQLYNNHHQSGNLVWKQQNRYWVTELTVLLVPSFKKYCIVFKKPTCSYMYLYKMFQTSYKFKGYLCKRTRVAKLWTAGCGPQIAGCRLHIAGCGPKVAGCVLRATDCMLGVTDCGLRATGCRLRAKGCGLWAKGCWLCVAGHRLQAAGCELQIAGCCVVDHRLRAAGCRLQVAKFLVVLLPSQGLFVFSIPQCIVFYVYE